MEKQIIFRDYQEQVAADHNNIQDFARASLDHLVDDVVTKSRRYAGFQATKTAQVEVTVAPGRFYSAGGAVYSRSTALIQSVVAYLPAAAQRIVAISVYGSELETDVQERDFLVDVATGATEPSAVPMTRSRTAAISFTSGAESAEPQPPPLPDTHAVIAYVLLDPTQVVSVTMQTNNAVTSTEELHARARALEAFRGATEPRITSLAGDLSALSNLLRQAALKNTVTGLSIDMARVKEALSFPDDASDYGADHFLTDDESDVDNSAALSYDALVQEGIRFPDAATATGELDIFSANDPNAKVAAGLLLPAYDSQRRIQVDTLNTSLGIAQYGFQTFDVVRRTMARTRLRYGDWFTPSSAALWWGSGTYDNVAGVFTKNGETFEVEQGFRGAVGSHDRVRQFWYDTYQEEYWDNVVEEITITGAQVAQTFLVSNDFWLTRIGFYVAVKAATENVFATLCEVTNGVPDLSKAILHQSIPHATLINDQWTVTDVTPTFLKAGKRYALVLTSNANHRLGMATNENSYLDGTFFYSTDGAYFQGDLTRDLMFELWGARFRASQVTIELDALSLEGGIRSADILASSVVPASTDLVYEVQPGGSGEWIALKGDSLGAFSATPPLTRFRARFVGTRDMMPALMLTDSEYKIARPKTAFTHISSEITLSAPATTIVVQCTMENFDDTPHDLDCRLRIGAGWETPDVTASVTLNAEEKRVQRTFTFNVSSTSAFRIELKGTTSSAANTFHVAERLHYVTA